MDLNKVRMKEHTGMVTNDTTTDLINFIISPLRNKAQVEKNDYVALNHPFYGETCPIIATVTDIKSYEQVAGSTLGERLGKLMGIAKIMGYVDLKDENKKIQTLVSPPDPGSRVYLVYSEFLEALFNTDPNGKPYNPPILFGEQTKTALNQKETNKQLNYYLDPNNLTQNHTLITGINNSGKTNATKIIINQLANKTQQPIVVFDPCNKYQSINDKQSSYQTEKICDIQNLTKSIKQKQVTVFASQDTDPEKKSSFYTKALETIWNARLQETIPPLTLVIENPEKIEKQTLETVVDEGPKYGLALILVTKHPIQVGPNILSQMSTQIIGKTLDLEYLKYLKVLLPKFVAKIVNLPKNRWIVKTNNQQQTTQIKTKRL